MDEAMFDEDIQQATLTGQLITTYISSWVRYSINPDIDNPLSRMQ